MPRARWFTALLVLAALVVPAQAQTKLQWKFVKDKPFYQEVKTTTKQDMTISNQKITQNQSQTFYFSWTPLSRDDKNKTWKVKQKIEGVKLNIEVGGTNISYDSTKGESQNNPLSDFFKQLVGSEFTLTIDDKGKIQGKIEGKDEFINKLVKNNAQMEPLLKDILSDEAFKQMADPTFAALPESAVKEQATWKRDYTLNMGPIGRYKVDNTYTYEGKDKTKKDLDKIAVKSNVTYIPPESKSTLQLPFKIEKAKLTSDKSSGQILYDPKKGEVVSSDMDLKITGDLDISIGGMTTKVELTQTQTTTVKTTDKNPLGGKEKKETTKEK